MNSTHLPPLPKEGESGPHVCDTVRLYLAILDDLTSEQVNLLFKHVDICSACSEEFRLMNDATRRVRDLVASSPSRRVDAAILALQSNQHAMRTGMRVRRQSLSGRSIRVISQAVVAIAAVLLFMFLTVTIISLIILASSSSLVSRGVFHGVGLVYPRLIISW